MSGQKNPYGGIAFAVTLMEDLVLPTFVLDADHNVIVWNRACERLTGVPAAEVIGTKEHWRAFYEFARPCLADLVATGDATAIEKLYTTHEDAQTPTLGFHAENWCAMPRAGKMLYLAVDAGPVYDDAGHLIAVVETLRDITENKLAHEKIAQQANALRIYYEENEREAELARRILERQIRTDLVEQSGIQYRVLPAAQFSGDLVLAARSPDRMLYALLADATGHGLAAAVSVLPIVQEFYRLVEQGEPLDALVESLNFLLFNSLPMGRFVAAAVLRIDQKAQAGQVWIGGLPDALLIDESGVAIRRFPSQNLPLGIVNDAGAIGTIQQVTWDRGCHFVVVSDGVLEASNPDGAEFGDDRLLAALRHPRQGTAIDSIRAALDTHLAGGEAHDDMSIVVIDGTGV